MELLKDLELADVRYEDEGAKAVLVFLDTERGEVREVNFNTKDFQKESNKFVESDTKKKKVEEWCQEYFELTYDTLTEAIGVRKDIFAYDTFNSLYEVKVIEKLPPDMEKQLIETVITSIDVDDIGIHVEYEWEGKTYRSNMNYAEYMESLNKWFGNPQKKIKQEARFEKQFHVPVDRAEELIGRTLMVEVKKFNGNVFGEMKALPKPKK